MADYQEYRRRVLRKRWRRRFMAAALLLLLLLVGAIGMLWKSLHREQRPSGVGQNTILQEVTQEHGLLRGGAAAHGADACRQRGHCAGFPYGGASKEQHGCGQGMVQ